MASLLTTFAGQRLYLHFVGVHHVYPGGFLVHHLFFGVALVMPAAFILAFGPRQRRTAVLARVALGSGSAMILDEIVYLVATEATDADYVSPLSLKGAFFFVSLGVLLIWFLYQLQLDGGEPPVERDASPAIPDEI
ncbi:MAG: hypothetical protein ABI680_00465 [Chthoniobacteraceae bacterium]